MSDIKILLVDDHAVVRMGFKMLIEAEPDMTVIAEAESGELGIKAFKEHKPDIVIMDITMPGIGGIEAIDRICAHDKSAKILVLSAHEQSEALGSITSMAPDEISISSCTSVANS